tara:strand:- start:17 stop:838 length:822 start_codon:yes stop_codon:yes gene_type:complete
MTEQLPTIFNYSSTNEYLPIDKQEDLYNFIQQLSDGYYESKPNSNLKIGLEAIYNRTSDLSDDEQKIIDFHSAYYYKVFSSLFTQSFHDSHLLSDTFFKALHDNAMKVKSDSLKKRNEIQRTSEIATENWQYNSNELKTLYYRLHRNNDNEYQNYIDNNTTLLRQGQLNHNMFLKQMEWNQFLKLLSACVCMILIIGYLASIEFSPTIIRLSFVAVFFIFTVNLLLLFMSSRRRHKLLYPNLRFQGYPVRDENTQKKYTGNCNSVDSYGTQTC